MEGKMKKGGGEKMREQLSLGRRILDAVGGFTGRISELQHDNSALRAKNEELTRRAETAERELEEIARAVGVEISENE